MTFEAFREWLGDEIGEQALRLIEEETLKKLYEGLLDIAKELGADKFATFHVVNVSAEKGPNFGIRCQFFVSGNNGSWSLFGNCTYNCKKTSTEVINPQVQAGCECPCGESGTLTLRGTGRITSRRGIFGYSGWAKAEADDGHGTISRSLKRN